MHSPSDGGCAQLLLFPAMGESLKLWFAVIGTPYLGYTKISPSRTFDAPEGDDYQRVGNCWVHQTLEGETSTVLLQSIRPSRVPGLGGLDEIAPRSQVTAHLAGVRI